MSSIDAAKGEFIAECQEILDRVSTMLNLLESGKRGSDVVDSLYRDMHTLKGSSQLFGFNLLGSVAHAMESSLEPLRKNHTPELSADFISALFRGVQFIENIFEAIRLGKEEENSRAEYEQVVATLVNSVTKAYGNDFSIGSEGKVSYGMTVDLADEKKSLQAHLFKKPGVEVAAAVVKSTEVKMEPTPEKIETKKDQAQDSAVDSTIRVPVNILDKLMNLVGELVLVRNQVLQFSQKVEDLEFLNLGQNLNMVTSDLQAEVMRTRMQPIGSIVAKFQRVVRDIAQTLSKKIDINIQGSETEVDKTLLEAVKDPLTHIIRNSCDHGIELPQERRDSGKPEVGTIAIKAYHEGGQVVIEISDDGRGLNFEKIASKALEKNLFKKEELDRMSDREISNIIFMPGFSTADQVSSVSGRGVGMDVVKTNLEKIGGTIDVISHKGKGMTISLRIPLTLAIVPAMIIRSGEERFAIPQVKLVELVRVEKDSESAQKIEFLHGKPVLRLRGHLLTLVHLREILGDIGQVDTEKEILCSDSTNIVVLHSDGISFGLIVDDIIDTGDIVVKPVGHFIKTLEIFSGATIMGNGSVALILDVGGLARKSVGDSDNRSEGTRMNDWLNSDSPKKINEDIQDFLLFETNAKGKYALPLCLVHRLEEFSEQEIEYSGSQKVIRYRNSILPIITVNDVLGLKSETSAVKTNGMVPVIVVQKNSRPFGIEVNSILDIVSIEGIIDDTIRDRPGIMGSAIHQDEVIVVVDILNIVDSEAKRLGINISEKTTGMPSRARTRPYRVLLAEDTAFFRKQIVKFLEKSGFHVTAVIDGVEALKMIKENLDQKFDLILSDIEMPNMDGLALARSIRELEGYKKTPLIAVTSKFKQKDREEGELAGFDRYLEKLNEEVLGSEISGLLKVAI